MDLEPTQQVCGLCREWAGPREWVDGKVRVKASARGKCQSLGTAKPPHGGCNFWARWERAPEK